MKYHVIINGMGGIATAKIYFAHFDDNNICTLTNGIAHSLHKSYDNFSEALATFQVYYPHCTTKQHIDFIDANAPLESSNLNNPCPYFGSLLRNYRPDPTKEVTYLDYEPSHNFVNHLQHPCSNATTTPHNLMTSSHLNSTSQKSLH
jgi:hypothetical protein